jgi:transcriptional regulator with XRE-family HTH domain
MQSTPSRNATGLARELLAGNLRRLRAEKSWSQEDLALEADLHRTFVAHVERRVRNISIDNVEKLAQALNVPVHQLLMPPRIKTEMQGACALSAGNSL